MMPILYLLMNSKNSSAIPLFFAIVIVIVISVSILVATETANAIQLQSQSTGSAPLNFYLKLNNNQSASEAASRAPSNSTGITITINVQKGPSGNAIKLPISALVPNNINLQELQICASLSGGQQVCQPLGQDVAKIDLSSSANTTPKTKPQNYQNNKDGIFEVWFKSVVQYSDAQLISEYNTTLNIPITVIIPIDLEIQNAQICASISSGTGQKCQQIVLNPTKTAYTPVNIDLSNPTTTTIQTQPTTQHPSDKRGNNVTPSAPSSTQQTPAGNVSGSPSSNSSSELPNASPNQPSPSTNTPGTTSDNPSSGESSNNNPSSSSSGSGSTTSSSDTGTTAGNTPSDSGTGESSSAPS